MDLCGALLRIGDQLLGRFALHPGVEHVSPALKHDLPFGQVAVYVVDSRDPVPRRMSQAHLDPAIVKLGTVQACRKRAAQVVNTEALKLRVVFADALHCRVDHAVERSVADRHITIVPAGVKISDVAENLKKQRQNIERLIA